MLSTSTKVNLVFVVVKSRESIVIGSNQDSNSRSPENVEGESTRRFQRNGQSEVRARSNPDLKEEKSELLFDANQEYSEFFLR
jgi:hypothetical protein